MIQSFTHLAIFFIPIVGFFHNSSYCSVSSISRVINDWIGIYIYKAIAFT